MVVTLTVFRKQPVEYQIPVMQISLAIATAISEAAPKNQYSCHVVPGLACG